MSLRFRNDALFIIFIFELFPTIQICLNLFIFLSMDIWIFKFGAIRSKVAINIHIDVFLGICDFEFCWKIPRIKLLGHGVCIL